MMHISVMGLGIVSKIGEVQDVEGLLTRGSFIPAGNLPSSHCLSIEIPDEYHISPQLIRRMSHFAKISLLSACRALKDSGLDLTGKSVGIIQGSVHGPIVSGIQAFDDLMDFGDNQLSPTNFSGSVFNTSATYLSLAFGIQGCTLSHTSGLDTLYNSLRTASLWLENGTADYVIMGVGDEYTTYFDNHSSNVGQATGLLPTGEGWTTYILSNDNHSKYGKIEFGSLKTLPETQNRPNIYSVWHEQIKDDRFINHAGNNQACFPEALRGSYPSAAAFDLALGLICGKVGKFPVDDAAGRNYLIRGLNKGEKICCYSVSEAGGLVCYDVI